jgi:hypothetical protein
MSLWNAARSGLDQIFRMPSLTGRGAGEARARLAADFKALRLPQSPRKVDFHILKMASATEYSTRPGFRLRLPGALRTRTVRSMVRQI